MNRKHELRAHSPKKSRRIGRTFLLFFLLIIIGAGVLAGILLFETEKPAVTLTDQRAYLGETTEIPFRVTDARTGIQSVVVEVEQLGTRKEIYRKTFPRRTWFPTWRTSAGPGEMEDKAVFKAADAELKDGEARLIITARDFSFNGLLKGNATVNAQQVAIDTQAPRVALAHTQRYISPGGSGLIVYDISEPVARHGVIVNDQFFPGYPVAERENRYLAYVALPWNTTKVELSRVVAVDEAGNEGKSVFSMILKQKNYKKDRINVSDNFLGSKIPEFEENSVDEISGETLVEKFLFVNNEIRRRNARRIAELCTTSVDRQLWQDRFLRMPGQSMAGFAEERTYYYQDRAIDQQVHLGMDIASTATVPIKAANRGKVVFADYMGIYGNTVILDHGQGVFSLYSHLSRIDTLVEDVVDQGTLIAYSGATGMAGGDHLHFSIVINGVFANPLEWMDQNWIDININDILTRL
ncbi:MAG: M23 family metallopeptidase [Desulfobulbaceae bacterium]|nr:M23 family metallopeptidase [Desulfobulbaceae bacterium]